MDGHLRADIRRDEQVRVAVLDLTPEESDLVLATFDPVSAMAEADLDVLRGLLDDVKMEVPADMIEALEALIRTGDPVEPRKFDTDVEDEVKYVVCPNCEHRFPK